MRFAIARFAIAIALVLVAVTSVCNAAVTKIMALGDSITHGQYSSDNGGYRTYLSNMLDPTGLNFQWVGLESDGPPTAKFSEGWDGQPIVSIADFIMPRAIPAYQPDIILLMVGTNDAWHPYPNSQSPMTTRENMLS